MPLPHPSAPGSCCGVSGRSVPGRAAHRERVRGGGLSREAPRRGGGALPGAAGPSGSRDRPAADEGVRRDALVPGARRSREGDRGDVPHEALRQRDEPRRPGEPDRAPRLERGAPARRRRKTFCGCPWGSRAPQDLVEDLEQALAASPGSRLPRPAPALPPGAQRGLPRSASSFFRRRSDARVAFRTSRPPTRRTILVAVDRLDRNEDGVGHGGAADRAPRHHPRTEPGIVSRRARSSRERSASRSSPRLRRSR